MPTCGKQIPGSPKWMHQTVATLTIGPFEFQRTGDFGGRRFATDTNDTRETFYVLTTARIAARLAGGMRPLNKAELNRR